MKMAKVFTVKTWINRDGVQMNIVTTVAPKATLEEAVRNVGLTMLNIASSEVSQHAPVLGVGFRPQAARENEDHHRDSLHGRMIRLPISNLQLSGKSM